jgi:predicted negative regulator of RcsB-dependent stress response
MPQDPSFFLTTAIILLIAVGFIAVTALRGWRDWIALKHAELERAHAGANPVASATSRIEVADLKERVKKLEAIAAGIDL